MVPEHFDVDEANALLPMLNGMLKRLRGLQHEARAKYDEMRSIREVGYTKDGTLVMLTDYHLCKRAFDRMVHQANELLAGINGMGCRVTDVELGLVDFPAVLDGDAVFLCWQLGEPAVAYYHGMREGYSGRRPIPVRR